LPQPLDTGEVTDVLLEVDGGGIMGITPALVLATLERQLPERRPGFADKHFCAICFLSVRERVLAPSLRVWWQRVDHDVCAVISGPNGFYANHRIKASPDFTWIEEEKAS
jgi:hypothetical protein